MVKGLTKRVVVVKFNDARVFEQAILLMRDNGDGVTEQQILQEACDIAEQYQREREGRARAPWLSRLLFALGGAGVVGLVWALC